MNQAQAAPPYADARDHLKDRLALLSLKLHREVLMMRALRGDGRQESFLGLFISERDVDAILSELHGRMLEDFPDGDLLQQRINSLEQAMAERKALTEIVLPIEQLAMSFDLSPVESELIVLALAPELDQRFANVYGFLQDDVSRKTLSAELAHKLIGDGSLDAGALRTCLHADAPLIHYQLLQLLDNDTRPLLARGIKLDNRTVNYLLGVDRLDDELTPYFTHPWSADIAFQPDTCTRSAIEAAARWQVQPSALVLQRESATDVDVWLTLFCAHANTALLCLEWPRLSPLDHVRASCILRKALREAHLTNSLLHVRGVDRKQPRLLTQLLAMATPLICITSDIPLPLDELRTPALIKTLPPLSADNRLACWRAALPHDLANGTIKTMAERYALGARTVERLCRHLHTEAGELNAISELRRACRREVGENMREVAQRIESPFNFSDLILPPAQLQSLRELIGRQSHTSTVFEDWGLGNLFRQSQGNAVLFIGPSGTGKTMAANVIANELGLDMYRIDLSGVVSKYIGETEKNLERIFNAAAHSQVVLFIDEADALFGKRSEVKDAHDRYANIEVSYLLQKMEEHPGIVILASNFCQNIDDAFFRRFSSVVEFTLPKAQDRLLIWQKLKRSSAPLDDNIDLEFLADAFDITGGHIKNCLMAAAFQAAQDNSPISMQMLIRAVGREYAKLGKPISKNNFGEYYTVLRRESAGGHV